MNLVGVTMVITGGTDGLGLALAKQAVQKGAKVHVIGRSAEKLAAAQTILGDQATMHQVDVSDPEQLQRAAAQIKTPQILINNAGLWLEGQLVDNTSAEIAQVIDVNLKGVIYSTKAFLPALLQASEAHLINVSSTSGLRGREDQAVYVASKYGVTGFTEALKVDLMKTNVKVSGFFPGGMNTGLFAKSGHPRDNSDWMSPDQVAEIVMFMLERDHTMVMDHVVVNKRHTWTSNK
jgi:short-subunit dehydrogenase